MQAKFVPLSHKVENITYPNSFALISVRRLVSVVEHMAIYYNCILYCWLSKEIRSNPVKQHCSPIPVLDFRVCKATLTIYRIAFGSIAKTYRIGLPFTLDTLFLERFLKRSAVALLRFWNWYRPVFQIGKRSDCIDWLLQSRSGLALCLHCTG